MIFTKSMMTNSRLAIALWASLIALPVCAEDARTVVTQTMDDVVKVLSSPDLSIDARRTQLEEIAYARFDFERMSRLILARNWKKLSPEQRDEFTVEFKKHLSTTYGKRLNADTYRNETIEVTADRKEKNGDVTVKTKIIGGAADGVLIDYRMRQSDSKWLVLDVIIERVSLVQNFRSQIQELISESGVSKMLERLREKNAQAMAQAS